MNFVFLMDPLESVNADKDTTLALMIGAHRKGHSVYYLPDGGITRKNGQTFLQATEVIPQYNQQQPFIVQCTQTLTEDQIDVIWIRTDPPFDANYLMNTWLLLL